MAFLTSAAPTRTTVSQLIDSGDLRAHYQPIVDLDTGVTVAFESLARGPQGSELESPAALFSEAARLGVVGDLDRLCRRVAIDGALKAGLRPPRSLFVNVEPSTLSAGGPIFAHDAALLDGQIRVVVEFTERDLAAQPAEVLSAVAWLRSRGCGIALDDVGVNRSSLALLPFISPDVIKLDMSLVQEASPSANSAHVIHAAAAEVERSGAILLAEGIETEEHLQRAQAMGATLGQGWLFGRPAELDVSGVPPDCDECPRVRPSPEIRPGSPFDLVADRRQIRIGDARLLFALSRQLEVEALSLGHEAVLLSTFQETHFTKASARRYVELSESGAFVGALGAGLDGEPAPGVRGAHVPADDPLRAEWDVVLVAPYFAGAFVARDLGDPGPAESRRFEYFVTYDRHLAIEAARSLMVRIAPAPTV